MRPTFSSWHILWLSVSPWWSHSENTSPSHSEGGTGSSPVLVISCIDYCNSLLAGLPAGAIWPLQLIQNAAARLVFNLPKFTHTTQLLSSLHWLPVAARIRFNTLVLAYRAASRTRSNLTPQPVHSALHLPIGLLLPHCELTTQQNHNSLLFWLLNGGMSSPWTSGKQKVYTSSADD